MVTLSAIELMEESFVFASCIRGHHISKDFWTPTIGETLCCEKESGNAADPYAVAVVLSSEKATTVGHVPRKISAASNLFLRQDGSSIRCVVTGRRCHSVDLPQGGMEVPCELTFKGNPKYVKKAKKLLSSMPPPTNISIDKLQPSTKKRKVESEDVAAIDVEALDPDMSSLADPAVPVFSLNSVLTEYDLEIVRSGGELNDKHINFAQSILKTQFEGIAGLQSTLLLSELQTPLPLGALQIVHVRGNHWIAASTVGCVDKVCVYNSLYSHIDNTTSQLLTKVFGCVNHIVEKSPRQYGVKDCGIFAIATSTCIAHGQSPSFICYDQSLMRDHLMQCYKVQCLTPFPTL